MDNKKKVSTKAICAVAAVVVIAVFAVFYAVFSEKPDDGMKNITIEVVSSDGESVVYEVSTDAEYLRGAMTDADGLEFDGYEGEFGFVVETVNGEYADFVNAYWRTTVNGADCSYGVDSQPVSDGDEFTVEYTTLG